MLELALLDLRRTTALLFLAPNMRMPWQQTLRIRLILRRLNLKSLIETPVVM